MSLLRFSIVLFSWRILIPNWLKSLVDKKDAYDDHDDERYSDSVRWFVKFYESLCVVRGDEADDTLCEDNPSYQCNNHGPVSPRIVEEHMSYSEHNCPIAQEDNHAIFLYEFEECDDTFTIDHQRDTSDNKDDSPKLREEDGCIHREN